MSALKQNCDAAIEERDEQIEELEEEVNKLSRELAEKENEVMSLTEQNERMHADQLLHNELIQRKCW